MFFEQSLAGERLQQAAAVVAEAPEGLVGEQGETAYELAAYLQHLGIFPEIPRRPDSVVLHWPLNLRSDFVLAGNFVGDIEEQHLHVYFPQGVQAILLLDVHERAEHAADVVLAVEDIARIELHPAYLSLVSF